MGEYVNSQNARFDRSQVSCGVVEVHHLPGKQPQITAFSIANHLYHKANPRPCAFVLFSDVVKADATGRGQQLVDYFRTTEGLNKQKVVESGIQINPRTGNKIRVWILEVDHEQFREWYTDQVMNTINE